MVVDLTPNDVIRSLKWVTQQLRYLAGKHFTLLRVLELCRLYQQKWFLAGALAPLDREGLGQVLDALVGRHLVLRESDGSFSVHPAVRDHFARLGTAEQGDWHDLLREQLVSLVERPGKRLAEDAASLDLVEEAIYHAIQAGRADEATGLYTHLLGGVRHLGWKLGEMARGRRILHGFACCPEPWDLAWYLRALGEFEDAYQHNNLPYFRADIRLLQGRLPLVAAEDDASRTAVAAFLMGQTTVLPGDDLGGVIPRDQVLLYLGRLDRVGRSVLLAGFYQDIGWEGDRARCELLLAERARRLADADACRKHLETAVRWILHAGSVEHLALLHLIRARAARTSGEGEAAQRAVEEGLHLARQCGLGLYHVELLCEAAEQCLARADAAAAEPLAAAALERASAADCQFAWGQAEAGHLLGEALAVQGRPREARPFLEKALTLRRSLHHPGIAATERLLAALPGEASRSDG
jgi:tetratricopeptide (TPR) repeat protein